MSLPPDEYALAAPVYDLATAWALDPLRRDLARLAAGFLAGRQPAAAPFQALDVCCGTGRQCLFFAEAGLRAVGADISPAMLARAARRLRLGRGLELVRADAARLPFPDGAFPFTSIALALHEKPPQARPAILAEMLRVTAPGGLAAVVDYLAPRTAGQRVSGWGIKAVERLAGREHHANYAHFMAGGGLEGFLRAQGRAPDELRLRFGGLMGVALLARP